MTDIMKQDEYAGVAKVLSTGDLSTLSDKQRVDYMFKVCKDLDLNPITKPLQLLKTGDKVSLYITKDGSNQLAKKHNLSFEQGETKVEKINGQDYVTVNVIAKSSDGRKDFDLGVVPLKGDYANAIKKSISQAKRRATLSICGLGILVESDIDDIPGDKSIITVDIPVKTEPEVVSNSITEEQYKYLSLMIKKYEITTEGQKAELKKKVQEKWGINSLKELKSSDFIAFQDWLDTIYGVPFNDTSVDKEKTNQ